jgi:hypothetical protein
MIGGEEKGCFEEMFDKQLIIVMFARCIGLLLFHGIPLLRELEAELFKLLKFDFHNHSGNADRWTGWGWQIQSMPQAMRLLA